MQEWISSPIGMHPVESGQWVLAADAYAERDRLAAENAEMKYWKQGNIRCAVSLAAANAALDRLREVVPEVLPPHMSWKDSLDGARAILYPPENKT